MNRTFSEFAALLGTILLLAVWCASGWLATETPPVRPFVSALAATAVLVLCAILLLRVQDQVLAENSLFTPVAYIVLATATPAALWFTPFHGAALLFAASVACFLHFCAVRPSLSSLFGTWIALGAAALIFPPFFWLAPVWGAVGKAEDKLKFFVTSLIALCLPVIIWLGVLFLRADGAFARGFFDGCWHRMTEVQAAPRYFPAATLCRQLLTILAVIISILYTLKQLNSYKIAHYAAILRIIVLTFALSLLMLFFHPEGQPDGLVTALPVAMLLNEYFRRDGRKKESRLLGAVLGLVLLAERISLFV